MGLTCHCLVHLLLYRASVQFFQSFFSVPNEGGFYLQSVDNEIVLWEPKTKEQSPGEVIQFNFPRIVFLL